MTESDTRVTAITAMLEQQRNQALNGQVNMAAEMAILRAQLEEATKTIAEMSKAPEPQPPQPDPASASSDGS